ncbi:MAG: hypothetical protein VB046_14295 [Paludibacter sp.]|nr:hypothetical protein [Paludibacter sp.]
MFNIHHIEAIKIIREWLDEVSYSTLNGRMMQFLDQTGQLYPDFMRFMGCVDRINPLYAFIFSVFRLGQPTERFYLDSFLPSKVVEALLETGMLIKKDQYYRMPDIGIIATRGMYFVTGLPEVYPTVSNKYNPHKPIDQSVLLLMEEIVSQPPGADFLEINADYGLLANIAAMKGFENIHIIPKHADYTPFIQLNLALNQHQGSLITEGVSGSYDLITCFNLSVREKIENRNQAITPENDLIRLIPAFRQLKKTGQAILFLESIGTKSEIFINEQLKAMCEFNIQSVVISKVLFPAIAMTGYVQSCWEEQLDLLPNEYIDYIQKTIEVSGNKAFVFTQLIKIDKQKKKEPFVLYPFYNPKYSDLVYNYASLTI